MAKRKKDENPPMGESTAETKTMEVKHRLTTVEKGELGGLIAADQLVLEALRSERREASVFCTP